MPVRAGGVCASALVRGCRPCHEPGRHPNFLQRCVCCLDDLGNRLTGQLLPLESDIGSALTSLVRGGRVDGVYGIVSMEVCEGRRLRRHRAGLPNVGSVRVVISAVPAEGVCGSGETWCPC